jgi:glutamine---fructose-6-phosphate transaminase (isomerizing)
MKTIKRKTDGHFAPTRPQTALRDGPGPHVSHWMPRADGGVTFDAEIRETPDALRRLLDYWNAEGLPRAARLATELRAVSKVIFTGMGSSINAAYPAKYLLARHGIAASIEPASELFYDLLGAVTPDTLVIAASQSGETIETNKVLAALEKHGRVWVVANEETSHMATCGRPFFPLKAESETRTSSKSYTNSLAMLYLIAEQIAAVPRSASDLQQDALVDAVEAALAHAAGVTEQMLDHWRSLDRLQAVARGASLASAHEFSLIVAENTSIFVQPIDGGAFRHGYNYLAGEDRNILLFVAESRTAELLMGVAAQVAGQGGRVVVLSTAASSKIESDHRLLRLQLPSIGSDLAPLLEILPLEILALKLAQQEGRDPGKLASKVQMEE